jgi:hypothetical protein
VGSWAVAACRYGSDAKSYARAVGTLGSPSCEQEVLAQLMAVCSRGQGSGGQQSGGVLAEEMALQVGRQARAGRCRAVSAASGLDGAAPARV